VGSRAIRAGALAAAFFALAAAVTPSEGADAGQNDQNVVLYVVVREALFFSAQSGTWTSVRLDAGERVVHRGTGENVALIVTDLRMVGYSSPLSVAAEIPFRPRADDGVEVVTVAGNVATVLTRRRAYGFSAFTGRWEVVERFQPR
jgi:hypothetical protein